MTSQFDVAIIGSGAMGSAAAYHLSKTKASVLVLDRYAPPHSLGSSHGESRIIREAYFESPMYVPLVRLAYQLWNELGQESGKRLFRQTGGLMIGPKNDKLFNGALASANAYSIDCEFLDTAEIKKRFPAFNPASETVALLEKNAGILFPEECIKTHLEIAGKGNVHFHFDELVTAIRSENREVEIITNKEKYKAKKVIATAGAWITSLFPELHLPLTVKRQVLLWFKGTDENREKLSIGHLPIFLWEYAKNKIFYGFPDLGNGMKVAIHHEGKATSADTINRTVEPEEIRELEEIMKKYVHAEVAFSHAAVCMYTNTPDEDFIIDYHPSNKNIIIASPCSGHGFKFSSAIGKILSEMVLEQPLSFNIFVFAIGRFISG